MKIKFKNGVEKECRVISTDSKNNKGLITVTLNAKNVNPNDLYKEMESMFADNEIKDLSPITITKEDKSTYDVPFAELERIFLNITDYEDQINLFLCE